MEKEIIAVFFLFLIAEKKPIVAQIAAIVQQTRARMTIIIILPLLRKIFVSQDLSTPQYKNG
jgi:hypothetical protein